MSFTNVLPPRVAKPTSSGMSLSLRVGKHTASVRLIINAAAQERLFGERVKPGQRFIARVGRGSDEGRLRLVKSDDGDLKARATLKDCVVITMAPWDLLPKDSRFAQQVELRNKPSDTEVELDLPGFCRPGGTGGKMESEFGLKRSDGKPSEKSAQ